MTQLDTPPVIRVPRKPGTPKPGGFLAARSAPLIYVNMPKSGCTTIKNILHRIDSGDFLDDPLTIHSRKDLLLRGVREPEEMLRRLKGEVVFTFVRHPLRRAYSCFTEKVHFVSKYSFPRLREYIRTEYGGEFGATVTLEVHRRNFKAFLRFSRESVQGTNGWRSDPHWSPQSTVLAQALRWRMIDIVGRVEYFEVHLKALMNFAGVSYEVETPRMNEGPPPPYGYEEVVDDEIRDIGSGLFRADLRNFGYTV